MHVDADHVARYAQQTEAALYFCTLEALQNVQKYAQASTAEVRLREASGLLVVEIIDDGCGFDPTTAKRGAGLTNMEDRVDALGGTLDVQSCPGRGTTLRISIPIPENVTVTTRSTVASDAARVS